MYCVLPKCTLLQSDSDLIASPAAPAGPFSAETLSPQAEPGHPLILSRQGPLIEDGAFLAPGI